MTATLQLARVMRSSELPDQGVGVWIGKIDGPVDADLELEDSIGYGRARLLVTAGSATRGFVELPIVDGVVDSGALRAAIESLPERTEPQLATRPAQSVVLCTRDRPDLLREALESLLALDYEKFEIIVVDNASTTDASERVVREFADPRIRLIKESVPGLARARNTGALAAAHDIVAFTDDDVIVDAGWLQGIALGFGRDSGVACVCGIVPSGEIRSASQAYFDRRVTWARSCVPKMFDMASPPAGDRLFPFRVGEYGTGANFAVSRASLFGLGGFDEALGAGSRAGGGEDIDWFVRTVVSGGRLAYEPSAIVWHRNRADAESLELQARA